MELLENSIKSEHKVETIITGKEDVALTYKMHKEKTFSIEPETAQNKSLFKAMAGANRTSKYKVSCVLIRFGMNMFLMGIKRAVIKKENASGSD